MIMDNVNEKIKHMQKTFISPDVCKAGRALASLTQRELAEGANVAQQTVADYERGARTPHPNNLRAMAEVLERNGIEFIIEEGMAIGVKKRLTP